MTITGAQIKELQPLSITISGEWLENQKYTWRGTAVSSEPIVAVVLLRYNDILEWCKSPTSCEILEVTFWISRYNEVDFHSQIGFSVGRGDRRLASSLESANYKPNIKASTSEKTGEVINFTKIEGKPKISFEVIFIARSNVKFGRNRIWHLREKISGSLPDNIRNILEKGRIGQITENTL
jgi:hypothetical protein